MMICLMNRNIGQCKRRKAKASAKVNMIQHSLRRSNGASKRSVDPADAKVGQTQHSPDKKSNTSSKGLRCRTSSGTSGSVRSTESASRDVSTEDTRRDGRQNIRQKRSPKPDLGESSSGTNSSEDEDEVRDRPKHTLKPPRFDGRKSFVIYGAILELCPA